MIGKAVPLWQFWNAGSTQAARWTSRLTPILSGIRNKGIIPLKSRRFSPIPTSALSTMMCLKRCRRSASSVTEWSAREEAAFSPDLFTVRTAVSKCCTVHPTTVISIKTFLTALCTAKAKKSVMGISFASKSWSGWFSSTFRQLWGISCDTRIISARSWRNSSAWKAMSKSASAESVWKATNAVLPSWKDCSSRFMRTTPAGG